MTIENKKFKTKIKLKIVPENSRYNNCLKRIVCDLKKMKQRPLLNKESATKISAATKS